SARLRYGAPISVLAVPFRLVFSVECVFCARGDAAVSRQGSRFEDAVAGAVLDRRRDGILFVFNDAGGLFDARVSGICTASGVGNGGGWRARVEVRSAGYRRGDRGGPGGDCRIAVGELGVCRAGRYRAGAGEASRGVYAVAGAYG